MKGAVFTGDRRVEVRDFPIPEAGFGEVVVRMKSSGICGSDLHFYRQSVSGRAGLAVIAGHEPCGVVHAVGTGVSNVERGDRVSVYHYRGCGYCRHCLAGNLFWCHQRRGYGWHEHGSAADYILTDARNCLPLPDSSSYAEGALMACAAGTAFSSLTKLAPSPGQTLVIFGQGPVGLCGLLLAKALGARVVTVEPNNRRRALSGDLGADEVLDPIVHDPAETIRQLTGGGGADLAFETSGAVEAHRSLLGCLGYGSRAVVVGFGSKENSVNLSEINERQLVIMGSYVIPLPMYFDLADFLIDRSVSLGKTVTHRYSLEEAAEAYACADSRETGKVVFQWDDVE